MKVRYCRSCKQPLPPSQQPLKLPVGATYYELYKLGISWADLGARFNVAGVSRTAWLYAKSAGLPWPPVLGSEPSEVPGKPVKLT